MFLRCHLDFHLDEVFGLIFRHELSFFFFFSGFNVKQTAVQDGSSQLLSPMSLCTQGNGSSGELTVTEPGKSSSGSFQFCFSFPRH